MKPESRRTLPFEAARFITHLPLDYRYTRSHFWIETREDNVLRVGFTSFATRMLGEVVDYSFDTPPGATVQSGKPLGWVEGFKAISDVISIGSGLFAGPNPALEGKLSLIHESTYLDGWLYELTGQLCEQSLAVEEYAAHLRVTIDRLKGGQQSPENTAG